MRESYLKGSRLNRMTGSLLKYLLRRSWWDMTFGLVVFGYLAPMDEPRLLDFLFRNSPASYFISVSVSVYNSVSVAVSPSVCVGVVEMLHGSLSTRERDREALVPASTLGAVAGNSGVRCAMGLRWPYRRSISGGTNSG
jgi:hypothetical protein